MTENLPARIALTISSGIVRLWIDSVFTQHGEKLKEWRTAMDSLHQGPTASIHPLQCHSVETTSSRSNRHHGSSMFIPFRTVLCHPCCICHPFLFLMTIPFATPARMNMRERRKEMQDWLPGHSKKIRSLVASSLVGCGRCVCGFVILFF